MQQIFVVSKTLLSLSLFLKFVLNLLFTVLNTILPLTAKTIKKTMMINILKLTNQTETIRMKHSKEVNKHDAVFQKPMNSNMPSVARHNIPNVAYYQKLYSGYK